MRCPLSNPQILPKSSSDSVGLVTMCNMVTRHDILPLPIRIFTRGDNDRVPGEVPCESDLARPGIKGSSQTMEYPATL